MPGEELNYRVSFGFIGIGNARMVIGDSIVSIQNRPSYQVDVYGATSGMVDWVARVNDHWGSYVDTAALLPHQSYRHIREGDYRKDEITVFNHQSGIIKTRTKDQESGIYKSPNVFTSELSQVRDMLSGYLYLRTVDFNSFDPGDHFVINGFLEDTFYPLEMVFEGYETIKTRAGKYKAIRLTPLMPEDGIFEGKRSVKIWISADDNRVPLRIEARMFVGRAILELSNYRNLSHPMQPLQ
jgi:hypothetical protein